jgi:DNA-binding transcriptional LysR family regulator
MSLNVHHLELFFYVAKHGGITEAVRKMPYGIQQPAVSGQILQLEKTLGVKLFHRRPFALTPAGEELFSFVQPFFSRIDQVASRLRGEESQHLRLAASATVMATHLPGALDQLRRECPALRLTLREVKYPDIEVMLQKEEADIAISVLQPRSAPGLRSVKLVELPQVLLVPPNESVDRFPTLIKRAIGGELTLPLISLPGNEVLPRQFQSGLGRRGLRWEPTVEVNDLSLIRRYVAAGFGWGLAVAIPGSSGPQDEVGEIPLPAADFAPLAIGMMHKGDLKPLAARFVEIVKTYAAALPGTASKKNPT